MNSDMLLWGGIGALVACGAFFLWLAWYLKL